MLLQPMGWLGHSKCRSTASYVPSLSANSSPGWRELLCPSWGFLLAWPQLGSPWSLWLSHATLSMPAGLFFVSPPAARI